jgi:hypothetical protein
MRSKALLLSLALAALWLDGAEMAVRCVKGGCSNHQCFAVKEGEEPPATTCEWTPSYGCYEKFEQCEPQKDGACGFSNTPALDDCLKNPGKYGFTL